MTILSPSDSLPLSVILKAPSHPSAIVQIVHGMCEHKERYLPFIDYMVECGFACIIHDHRGHGQSVLSANDLGYMYDDGWNALIDDVKAVNDYIKSQYPHLPCILFGHSMGSLVVRSFAKRYDDVIDQLFVCGSPSYNPASVVAKWLCRLLMSIGLRHHRPQLIQFLSFSSFNKPFKHEGYPAAWICSDKDILEQYHHDPLCTFTFTANGFYNLFRLMQDCYSDRGWHQNNKSLKVHFISGANDPCRISDKDFQKSVAQMQQHYDCSSRLFEDMRHEILNETNKSIVWEYILNIIKGG